MLFSFSLSLAALALSNSVASAGHFEKSRLHHGRALQQKEDLSPALWKRFSGTATYYAVGLGACGKYNVPSDFIVALNTAQFGGGYPGPNCFKSITITAKGKSVGAVIMDACPTCGYGDLDLSQGLFEQFANTNDGVFQMTWTFSDGSGGGSSGGGSSNNDNNDAWVSKSSVSAKSVASVASVQAAQAEESRASVAAAESWASKASVSDKSVASEASKESVAQESLASVSQYSVTSVAALATSAPPSSTFVTSTTSDLPAETGTPDAKPSTSSDGSSDTSSSAEVIAGNNLGLVLYNLKQFGTMAAAGASS